MSVDRVVSGRVLRAAVLRPFEPLPDPTRRLGNVRARRMERSPPEAGEMEDSGEKYRENSTGFDAWKIPVDGWNLDDGIS